MKDRVLTNPVAHDQFWSMLRSEWLQWRLNRTPLWRIRKRNRLLCRLFASVDGPVFTVQLPFHAALGNKTHIGKNFFANHNCMIYDREEVYIGDNVLLGPNVIITTIAHPMEAKKGLFHIRRTVLNHTSAQAQNATHPSLSAMMYGLQQELSSVRVLQSVIKQS